MDTFSDIIHGVVLLLAVINPIGNIPVYVSLTDHLKMAQQKRILNTAVLVALGMVIFFAMLGDWTLRNVFEVGLDEFKIAGGILLFVIAAQGVLSTATRFMASDQDEGMMAIFPLAFPIIVGPGTLAVTIILAQKHDNLFMIVITLLAFMIVFTIVRSARHLMKWAGPFAGMIIARLLYIILAAKAVAMICQGIKETFNI